MRARCLVPFITGALKHRIGGHPRTLLAARMPTHTLASVAGGPLRIAAGRLTSSARGVAILGYALRRHRPWTGCGMSMREMACCLTSWPCPAAHVPARMAFFRSPVSFVGSDFCHSVSSGLFPRLPFPCGASWALTRQRRHRWSWRALLSAAVVVDQTRASEILGA